MQADQNCVNQMDSIFDTVVDYLSDEEVKDRPKVCLTWAQSLDGKLAAAPGRQTLISCDESMQMTHALRALHASIMVGIGTVLADDPRLSCRLNERTYQALNQVCARHGRTLPSPLDLNPCPVILDSLLRLSPQARCLQTRLPTPLRKPLVFGGKCPQSSNRSSPRVTQELDHRTEVVLVDQKMKSGGSTSALCERSVLRCLKDRGIDSVMIEGGANVISSFLEASLWDIAIVTIAPTIFRQGVSLDVRRELPAPVATRFSEPSYFQLGNDIVLVARPP